MNLDKKLCRLYAVSDRKLDLRQGIFYVQAVRYIVLSAIRMIGGHRTLVLYIYSRESALQGNTSPRWVMFQNRDTYVTLEFLEDNKIKWRTAAFESLDCYYFARKCAFYTAKDEQLVVRFCRGYESDGFECLREFQQKIKDVKALKRQHQRERRVLRRMEVVAPVPRGLNRWAHRNVLPAYFFYTYQKNAKTTKGVCTSCGKEVELTRARHNETGICPACGRSFTMKSRGRRGRIHDSEHYQVLQRAAPDELLIRIFRASYQYEKHDTPRTTYLECSRIFVKLNEKGQVETDPYYNSYYKGDLTHWRHGERPRPMGCYYNPSTETCCKIYCKTLAEALSGTPWQYCPLEQYHCAGQEPMQVVPFLKAFLQHPKLEHLVKLGFYTLVSDVTYDRAYGLELDEHQNRTHRILHVGVEDVSYLKSINIGSKSLMDFQKYCKCDLKARQELFSWQLRHKIDNIERIIMPLLEHMTANKLMRYMDQQYSFLQYRLTPNKTKRYSTLPILLSEYCDYIRMCQRENYDLANDFVLFPKDIQKSHDRVSHHIKAKADAKMRHDFRIAYSRIKQQLDFEMGGMKILYPKSPDDLVAEGHALHHCVGSYVDMVAGQKCIVVFLRRTEREDTPFYTIEIRNRKVVQVRGDHNAEVTKEVSAFIAHWEKKVLLRQPLPNAA